MAKLTCQCLNISLNINEEKHETTEGCILLGKDANDDSSTLDEFFKGELIIIKLAVAGIEVQQKLLIKERIVDDFKVFKCINCDLSTHAVHRIKGVDRVVASKALGDTAIYNELRQSTEYSPVFKIILKTATFSNVSNDERDTQAKMFHRSLSEANLSVNRIVEKFLGSEAEAMQERIRLFTENQKEVFAQLQKKVEDDKGKFLRLISKKEEKALQTSLDEAMKEAVLFKTGLHESESEDIAPDLPQIKGKQTRSNRFGSSNSNKDTSGSFPTHIAQPNSLTSRDNKKHSSMNRNGRMSQSLNLERRRAKTQVDDDTLFNLDEFPENKTCEPFFESDEDSTGDSNSLDSSGGYTIASRELAGERIYATSVPVGIPMFHTHKRGSSDDNEERDVEPHLPPDKIAESIKALAKSLHDSTSIFGELPTPRYNTMPHK